MNSEVDYAILAMAQYFQESHPNLYGVVSGNSEFNLGFSATTYTRGNEVTIVYRGSDSWQFDFADALLLFNGNVTSQARAAIEYYNEVRDNLEPGQTISIAGHSLGGALASFVSLLTGAPAYGFNTGHVGVAAARALFIAQTQHTLDNLFFHDPTLMAFQGILEVAGNRELLDLYDNMPLPDVLDGSNLAGLHLRGDVLGAFRSPSSLQLWMPNEDEIELRDFNPTVGFLSPFAQAMHQQSLLTIRAALSETGLLLTPAWTNSAKHFFSALHDNAVADAGKVESASQIFRDVGYEQLQILLAFSASSIGINISGDAAFESFKHDGEHLGLQEGGSEALHDALAKTAVSHSGLLATRKAVLGPNDNAGVLHYDEIANSLALDMTVDKWTIGGISERANALDFLLTNLTDYISGGLTEYIGEIEDNYSIDAFVFFAETEGNVNHSLAAANNAPFVVEADLVVFVGSEGEDAIVAATSDDIVDGSNGFDSITYNELDSALTITLHHAGENGFREIDIRSVGDEGLGKLFNIEAVYATDFNDTINVLPAEGYMTPDSTPTIARPAIYINGGLGDDTFSIDLTQGSPNAIFDGGDGDDVFTIIGDDNPYAFANTSENRVVPTILIGGEGVDKFEFSGEVNVFFAYLDDVANAGRLDLEAIADYVQLHSMLPRYSTVVIVNPDQSDEIFYNGVKVQGATASLELISEQETGTGSVSLVGTSEGKPFYVGIEQTMTTRKEYRPVYYSDNFEYFSYNEWIEYQYGDLNIDTYVTVHDADEGTTLQFFNFTNGMAGVNIGSFSGAARYDYHHTYWTNTKTCGI